MSPAAPDASMTPAVARSNDPVVQARLDRARALVERFPDRAPPHFSLGRALHDAGALAEAVDHYRRAAALQPDLMMAHLHAAECALALGDASLARSAAEAAQRLARQQGHSGPLAEATDLLEAIDDLDA